jgi:hypothetical protein
MTTLKGRLLGSVRRPETPMMETRLALPLTLPSARPLVRKMNTVAQYDLGIGNKAVAKAAWKPAPGATATASNPATTPSSTALLVQAMASFGAQPSTAPSIAATLAHPQQPVIATTLHH